ncbi:hypothetical protein NQ318_004471 [Aromia moschata]|uniref:Uncharacterized protein n=1 Tax=Aromia moschata TaxID=1265417 RepID=A0AAV8YCT7_9CUCU|nr:hypothetical protein NQ318_004471 [Aromia moschata]
MHNYGATEFIPFGCSTLYIRNSNITAFFPTMLEHVPARLVNHIRVYFTPLHTHATDRSFPMSRDSRLRGSTPISCENTGSAQRARAIAKLEENWSLSEVAAELNVSKSCIFYIKNAGKKNSDYKGLSDKRLVGYHGARLVNFKRRFRNDKGCCQLEIDPDFLPKVITGDESWCYSYDPETKQQSSQWKRPLSPRPKKFQVKSNINTMLICFFDAKSITPAATGGGQVCEVHDCTGTRYRICVEVGSGDLTVPVVRHTSGTTRRVYVPPGASLADFTLWF